MVCNHLISDYFPYGRGSIARWAIKPSGRLIVFVHGFGGDALATWDEFPRTVDKDAAFEGADIVFYGYESKSTRANLSAAVLRSMIDNLVSSPVGLIRSTTGLDLRPSSFVYDRVIVVAHSLGGALARRVAADASKLGSVSFTKMKLVLFAPAHLGGDIIKIAMTALTPSAIGSVFGGALKVMWPVLNDLEPGSDFLAQLARDTSAELASCPSEPLVASVIVFGDRDRVVVPNNFCDDPPPFVIPGRGHTSICKPDPAFTEPVQIVANLL